MNQRPLAPTAALLQQRLQSVLQPSALEVIDESAQHSGHVGANDSGFGSHFRVRITSHLFTGKAPVAGSGTPCKVTGAFVAPLFESKMIS